MDIENIIDILQVSDSFFPSGMFAMSNGLESMFYAKQIAGATGLADLVSVQLACQIGPADCVALGNTFTALENHDFGKVIEIDHMTFSIKLVQEIRNASVRSGSQFIRCLDSFISNKYLKQYSDAIDQKQAHGIYPVALAVGCASLGISKQNAAISMMYTFCVSMIGAALRLGIISHLDGQSIIHALKPTIFSMANKYVDKPLSEIWQSSPSIDIFQMQHERLDSKMFIT